MFGGGLLPNLELGLEAVYRPPGCGQDARAPKAVVRL